eukprot:CAMPEP_0175087518 /NCGR_PEP_ID=MMETSP0052_2-20121109/29873_1 /TAXON_ID=51329 ORGANISM="Polytomella parva, Strain SAG 63-3" /NCGR_SAMPLE_ID=MMETSP0052_2 /ASSEMBLY_ACC=CAM_ASM_000194 /LENGTH=561 /DNA_ID=CAMNT_0016359869 /DNA_START=100 /DNA_END=1785 /DNA_ORIENTATION=+
MNNINHKNRKKSSANDKSLSMNKIFSPAQPSPNECEIIDDYCKEGNWKSVVHLMMRNKDCWFRLSKEAQDISIKYVEQISNGPLPLEKNASKLYICMTRQGMKASNVNYLNLLQDLFKGQNKMIPFIKNGYLIKELISLGYHNAAEFLAMKSDLPEYQPLRDSYNEKKISTLTRKGLYSLVIRKLTGNEAYRQHFFKELRNLDKLIVLDQFRILWNLSAIDVGLDTDRLAEQIATCDETYYSVDRKQHDVRLIDADSILDDEVFRILDEAFKDAPLFGIDSEFTDDILSTLQIATETVVIVFDMISIKRSTSIHVVPKLAAILKPILKKNRLLLGFAISNDLMQLSRTFPSYPDFSEEALKSIRTLDLQTVLSQYVKERLNRSSQSVDVTAISSPKKGVAQSEDEHAQWNEKGDRSLKELWTGEGHKLVANNASNDALVEGQMKILAKLTISDLESGGPNFFMGDSIIKETGDPNNESSKIQAVKGNLPNINTRTAIGLSDLVLSILGKPVCKELRMMDWSLRPLTPRMIDYAALDAVVLVQAFRAVPFLRDTVPPHPLDK